MTRRPLKKELIDLVRLEYDTLEACRSAQRHCQSEIAARLAEIQKTHEMHIQSLVPAVRFVGGRPPRAGDARQFITQLRVVAGAALGQRALLSALKDNEIDVALAYHRVLQRDDLHDGIRHRLDAHAANATLHHRWLREAFEAGEG